MPTPEPVEHVDPAVAVGSREVGVDGRPQALAVLDRDEPVHRRATLLDGGDATRPGWRADSTPSAAHARVAGDRLERVGGGVVLDEQAEARRSRRRRRRRDARSRPPRRARPAGAARDPSSEYGRRVGAGAATADVDLQHRACPCCASCRRDLCPRVAFVPRARHGHHARHPVGALPDRRACAARPRSAIRRLPRTRPRGAATALIVNTSASHVTIRGSSAGSCSNNWYPIADPGYSIIWRRAARGAARGDRASPRDVIVCPVAVTYITSTSPLTSSSASSGSCGRYPVSTTSGLARAGRATRPARRTRRRARNRPRASRSRVDAGIGGQRVEGGRRVAPCGRLGVVVEIEVACRGWCSRRGRASRC